jgi:hypothetical protein
MMLKKLTILALSGILTVGLVAAAAPSVNTEKEKVVNLAPMINACRQGYINYKLGGVDGQVALKRVLDKFNGTDKDIALLICYGYGAGYDDGARGLS